MSGAKPSFSRRRVLLTIIAVMAACGVIAWIVSSDFDWQRVARAMEKLNTSTLLTMTAVLPLAGFPVSLVYLSLGARFGPSAGLGVVAVITLFHLLAAHAIARSFLRKWMERFIKRRGHEIPAVPPGENANVALVVMLAPAVPYFLRNYLLGFSGIPFRIYCLIALPIHVLRSYVALFLGDFGSSPSSRGLWLLALIYTVKFTIFAVIAWHLRLRFQRMKPKSGPHSERGATRSRS